ncbi:amino acid adenylation domain-containing protein [Paenibacillus sp. JGP012]|uniref:non-ribosomal peptide synthetase n=1 Tax=Paenibacillus sp. JGP012 TaxID=2735914 RepID=UPI0016219E12|nr:non-ribosomal peptide synthetase [Paenibacillus sp. JGP012]MBB6023382.1 amino acid adenylation domain-containing protein [Paenibacillus sp. JGP012]
MKVSYTQETLWLLERMSRESGPAYNEPLVFQLKGHLDMELLIRSMHHLVERHESLRTTFVETVDGLKGIVHDNIPEFVEIVDLQHLIPEKAREQAERRITDTYGRRFDLANGPLIRAIIVKVTKDEYVLGITAHHIVIDGWSMGVILSEIGKSYIALCRSGELAAHLPVTSYYNYVSQLRQDYEQGVFQEKVEYWKSLLQDRSDLLNLPVDRIRPSQQTFRGSTYTIRFSKSKISALIDKKSQAAGTTEFAVMMSAYALLLHRYSSQNAITIGTTVLNRDDYDYFGTVGCFVNTAAIALSLDGEMTFRELVMQVSDRSLEMLQYQDAPYPKVLESLNMERDTSYNPVFQTMMTSLGKKPELQLGDEIICKPVPFKRTGAKFDLLLYVSDVGEDFEFEVEYNTDLFDESSIERIMNHYSHLLDHLAMDLDVKVSRVSIIPDEEKSLILDVWNNTNVDYPKSNVIDMIEAQAARTPESVAVQFRKHSLTYNELNNWTNRVARFLRSRQETKGEFIGVYMDRSIEMVVALVSIMKAGLAYVPIDPEYPADRIRYMIDDSGVPLILTQAHHTEALATFDTQVITLAELDLSGLDESNVKHELGPDSACYMIYTSGSTGRPKGVVNRHEALFNRLYWMQNAYQLTGEDHILQKTPFSFDVSVWEFFWPLMFGARIVMAEPGGHRDPDYLKQIIQEKHVSVMHFVPSMLNVFLEEENLADYCGSLRLVFCSGEALPYSAVKKFMETLTCEMHNLYGPTEAAIDVSYWPCTLDYPGNVVPIGKPIDNVRLYVLDPYMQIQPIKTPGELYIGGLALARGYHNRDELTEKAFVPDPFSIEPGARLYKTGDLACYLPDGQIQYLTRIDNQVKLRGFRIELGEIEAVVRSLQGVKDAAVVVHEANGTKMLCAYVVADEFNPQKGKEWVADQLPEFMVPRVFVQVPQLVTTANGKLNRSLLPDPFAGADLTEDIVQPSSEQEHLLLQIWREVLGQDQIGITTNFFRLGGDSILSIRVSAKLRELGYHVEIHEIFANPTIQQLAKKLITTEPGMDEINMPFMLVDQTCREQLGAGIEDAWPLATLQAGMIYHSMLHAESPVYHDIFAYDIEAPVYSELVLEALRAVASNRPQLRSAFDLDTFNEPLQLIYSEVEPSVELTDIRYLAESEQERTIQLWMENEKKRKFDFTKAPLYRVHIHIRSNQLFSLGLSFHHAILDGWSVALILRDFCKAYAELVKGSARADIALKQEQLLYSQYIALERKSMNDPAHRQFWMSNISSGTSGMSFVKSDTPLNWKPGVIASREQVISEQQSVQLKNAAHEFNLPIKSVLLAIHFHVLSRMVGDRHVTTGLVVNGRPEMQGSEEMAGLFLNTIPLTIELSSDLWPSIFQRVFELEQKTIRYRRYPLAEIVKQSGHKALFDVAFNYTDFHVYEEMEGNTVKISNARYFEQTNIPVVVHAHQDHFLGQMRLTINYDVAHVEHKLVQKYLELFQEVTSDALSDREVSGLSQAASRRKRIRNGAHRNSHLIEGNNVYIAPRTALEANLAEIISSVLNMKKISIDDDFMRLGMDSIIAIRVVAKAKRMGIGLSLQDIFEKTTIQQLAEHSSYTELEKQQTPVSPFELIPMKDKSFQPDVVDAYPITAMQQYMINKHRIDLKQSVYHDVFTYHLGLPFQENELRYCLEVLSVEHEIFRTSFDLKGYSCPMQLVYDSVQLQLEVEDISFLPEEERAKSFHTWFEMEKGVRFEPSQRGWIRFYVHRWGAEDFKLTLSFHHAVIDGWSLSLFINELIKMYRQTISFGEHERPQPMTLRYRDYVKIEQKSQSSKEMKEFWLKELHNSRYNTLFSPHLEENTERWSETKVSFNSNVQENLHTLAKHLGVPVKHVLLAGHLAVMSHCCTEKDVLTGVFANGRPEEEEGEKILGMFLNFVPFRQEISTQTWSDLILGAFETERRYLPYRRYPLTSIQEDMGQERLFETIFNYTHFEHYSDPALLDVQWFEHTDFKLLANMGHDLDNTLVLTLNSDGRKLSQRHLQTIGKMYDTVYTRMIEDADALVEHSIQKLVPFWKTEEEMTR